MNVSHIKDCLTKAGRRELGIPVILPSMANSIFELAQWSLEGNPIEGRQVWFVVGNAKQLRDSLPAHLRSRIMPLQPSVLETLFHRGPFDALLLPIHGFSYSDPNLTLSDFWNHRGSYEQCREFQSDELHLWFWKSKEKPLKLFAMDHHHAVLWDAMQILRPLGIQVDFHWLSDGRPPINEAIPCEFLPFKSSLDLYRPPVDQALPEEFFNHMKQKNYDGILTSHSLVTCYRLRNLGLPMVHVNSTRFGNDWIQDPKKHAVLVESIQELLRQSRLHIIHNNQGDQQYFHQYVPHINPCQEVVIPSLCESHLRLRMEPPAPTKLLIWDTRQVLLQPKESPFMKDLYSQLKHHHKDAVESQAVLMAQSQQYLPEGYLDSYTAVVHIPYNISTMSMFQQNRANIPIWVPSKRLLKELWLNPKEPNELSWCLFAPGSEKQASTMDSVRDPLVVERWIECADFYNPEILPLCFQFDSIEELVEKAFAVDYKEAVQKAEQEQQQRRENIIYSWEQAIRGGLNNSTSK